MGWKKLINADHTLNDLDATAKSSLDNSLKVDGSGNLVTNNGATKQLKAADIDISVSGGKISLDGAQQTLDADTIGGHSVEKNVPSNAVFTDTQLTKTEIDAMNVDAGSINSFTVEKSVPSDALFTDTQRADADFNSFALNGNSIQENDVPALSESKITGLTDKLDSKLETVSESDLDTTMATKIVKDYTDSMVLHADTPATSGVLGRDNATGDIYMYTA
jgi:hypothetical protein